MHTYEILCAIVNCGYLFVQLRVLFRGRWDGGWNRHQLRESVHSITDWSRNMNIFYVIGVVVVVLFVLGFFGLR